MAGLALVTSVPEKVHSELGASVAHRWMNCPGSVQLSRGQPNYGNEHSRAGTAAHAVAEMALRKGVDADLWIGTSVEGVEVTEDMAAGVQVYVEYCRGLIGDPDSVTQFGIEERFTLAELNPPGPMFGTTDFWCYDPMNEELEIVDYKNGSGVVVEVKGNMQLRYYALGAVLKLGKGRVIGTVKTTIVQPNAPHVDGVVRSVTFDYLDLLAFAGELLAAARRTLAPDAPLVPGKHCRFCPASAICPAQREQAQALAQVAFADMPLDRPPAPESLPPEILGDILDKLPILDDWMKSVYAHARHELEQGRPVHGRKMVAGKRSRDWADEKETEDFLLGKGLAEEELYKPRTLKSPAQVEKAIGKKHLPAELVAWKDGNTQMVSVNDPRPALALSPGDVFLALPSGE